jgi:hypothetical protein|uniref:Uncharacterized protein n=1 Tax=viral metagenome TaxID=1070528 RepID=A0A6C0LBE2_9ZZZZ
MGYKEHYSNSSNNDIQKEAEEIASIVYDYELIIKASLVIILLYTFISNIFNISSEVINNNLKLYAFISLMIILYALYKLDIISLLKLLIILIVVSVILASIYYNLEKLEFLILFYYSFNYQLEKIYNETKTNYSEVLFSFIFIAIISMISIVLYWDNIYTDAKKLSKCGKIINTIENNNKNKKAFVYNIIIINNDLIDTTTSKYILKITYDFIKKKTIVDYGTDDGDYSDGSESFKKPDYNFELNNKKRVLDSLKGENAKLEKELDKLDEEADDYNTKKTEIDTKINYKTEQIKQAQDEYNYIKALNDPIIEAQKKLVFYYLNLKTMKSEKIENIDANMLGEERFKYILVDDNNNKLPYDETGRDLIKFTKIYSKNEKYNTNIINDIFYAKNNREKLFI